MANIISDETIEYVGILAKLELSGEEKEAAKNMVIMAIKVGKRPLQGTKLLVRIAMRRSRGDSMIRHPVTPQALQPKPMHIVG